MVALQGRSISIQNQVNWAKSKIYNLGVRCYRHSSAARQVFDGASIAFGRAIGLSFNPNYRYGEIRQEIRRLPEFSSTFEPEVLPSDLISKPEISQSGISREAKNEKAWQLINKNMSEDLLYKTLSSRLKKLCGALSAGIGLFASQVSGFSSSVDIIFLGVSITGFAAALIFVTRASTDEICSARHRNISFEYLIREGEKKSLEREFYSIGEKARDRFIKCVEEVDSDFASELKSLG